MFMALKKDKNTGFRPPGSGRIKKLLDILDAEYGLKKTGSKPSPKPMDELILTVLSQNTNDRNRNKAYAALRGKYPEWKGVAGARVDGIARAIKVGGLAQQKARRIKDILNWAINEKKDLELSYLKKLSPVQASEELLALKGVGEKTAACVLLFSLSMPAFPVDTHVYRIAKRLHFIPEKASVKDAHAVMSRLVPKSRYYSSHLNIIQHGRSICHARGPECPVCPLRRSCPSRTLFNNG